MNRKGFTLIELIVVVIIVGILAAIAGPMMSGNMNKAKTSEAIAGAGALRTASKLYLVENPSNTAFTRGDLTGYVAASDLNGTYYYDANYSIAASSSTVTVNNGTAGLNITFNMTTGKVTTN